MTKRLALALVAVAAVGLVAPAANAKIICRYYKTYDPINGQTYTTDLTWCNV